MLHGDELRVLLKAQREKASEMEAGEGRAFLEDSREIRLLGYLRAIRFWQFWGPLLVALTFSLIGGIILSNAATKISERPRPSYYP